jgi:SAM-dependent methyltransferase
MNMEYYDRHAVSFYEATLNVDMNPLYRHFLPLIPKGGHLLDAGCGSARDARAFAEKGFQVTAFDASAALVRLAQAHLGNTVYQLRFQDIAWRNRFDGVWACASLLHVPLAELPDVLRRLCLALKPGGILYASFKYGSGERFHEGRRFTDLDEAVFTDLLQQVKDLKVLNTWITGDLRPDRESERWFNITMQRREGTWGNS